MPTQSNKPKLTLTSFNKKEESERKNLTRLNLEETEHWELDDLKKNFEKVFQCKNIYHLRVLFSKEPHHVTTLLELLEKNNTITELDLSYNRLDMCPGWESALAKLLKVNKTIRKLNLCRTTGLHTGLDILANALAVNTTLKILDLSKTGLTFVLKANAIVKILQGNTALRTLCIRKNTILPKAAKQIVKAAVERREKRNPIKFDNQLYENRSAASYWAALRDELCTKIWQREGYLIKFNLTTATLLGIGVGLGVAQVMPLWPLMTCGKALAILFSVGIVATMCANYVLSEMPLILFLNTLIVASTKTRYEKELRISKKDRRFYAFVALGAFLGLIGTLIVIGKFCVPFIIFTLAGHTLSVGGRALLAYLVCFAAMSTGMLIGGSISASAFLAINKWINQPFDKATALIETNKYDITKFPGAMNKTDTCSLGA